MGGNGDSGDAMAQAALLLGRLVAGQLLVERYRLVTCLHQSGASAVWRCDDLQTHAACVLKLLGGVPDAVVPRVLDDLEQARRVRHPGLCRILAAGLAEQMIYQACEPVAGVSLQTRLEQGDLGADDAFLVLRQVSEALSAAHAEGVVHGRLDPAKIMLAPDGRVVLLGLGWMRRETLSGAEPPHAPPEHMRGEPPGHPSDVYGLGLLIRQLLTMQPQAARALEAPMVVPGFSPRALDRLGVVLVRTLSADPAGRFASVFELHEALTAVLSGRFEASSADTSLDASFLDATETLGPLDTGSLAGQPGDGSATRAEPQSRTLSLTPGMAIGHHETIRLLGRGGMGEVWLARDVRLGRLVVLKFLRTTSPAQAQRFVAEARTTAQLAHENIVSLYDIGEHEGVLYMVLEYVRGQTLRQWLADRAAHARSVGTDAAAGTDPGAVMLSPRRAVELMLPVVRALCLAHDAGVVHRDLKLANVMCSDSGMVKVLDFGVAKLMDEGQDVSATMAAGLDADLTDTGALVGTLRYMSPEQWSRGQVDHRADLWAVGLMLHELCTGGHPLETAAEPPLAERLSQSQLRSVADLTLPMPSVRAAHPELGRVGAIIDRCLIKRKEDRVGSARALLLELEAVLVGQRPVLAEDLQPFAGLAAFQERDALRFFGRERAVGQALSRLAEQPLVAVIGPSGAGKSSFVRAGLIPALKRSGEAWEGLIVRPGPSPLIALAELLLHFQAGTSGEELACGESHREPLPGDGEREHVRRQLHAAPGQLGAMLRARARRKRAHIVLFCDQLEEVFTLADAAERAAFFACLCGAADDVSAPLRVIVSMRSDFLDRIATVPAMAELVGRGVFLLGPMCRDELHQALVAPAQLADYRFESEDMVGEMLDALAGTPGTLPLLQFTAAKLWEHRDRQRRLLTEESYRRLGGVAGALSSHADAVLAAMSSAERRAARVVLLRLVTPERTRALLPLAELGELLGAAPADLERVVGRLIDARLLTVAGSGAADSTVEIVHESLLQRWPTLGRWLDDSAHDAALVARLRSAAAQWDRGGRKEGLLWTGEAAQEAVRWLRRGPDHNAHLGLAEREIRYLRAVANLAERARRRNRAALGAVVAILVLVASGTSYLAWQRDSANRIARQQAARAEEQTLRTRDAVRMAAARSYPDDAAMRLGLLREIEGAQPPPGWSREARLALAEPMASAIFDHTDRIGSVAFSPDGRRIASASFDGSVRVWSSDRTGIPLVLRGHSAPVVRVAFSPDGKRIVSASFDKTVRVWSADDTGAQLVLAGHTDAVWSAAFSPDGRRIVSAAADKTVRVWNSDGTGAPVILSGHTLAVRAAAFSPDGKRIVSAAWDRTVRIWNSDGTGAPLVLFGHTNFVNWAAFSPDGRRIASASSDKTVRVWNSDGAGAPLVLFGHTDAVVAVAFSPDGRQIVSAAWDKTVRIWNSDGTGAPLVLPGHADFVNDAAFSPDGKRVVSAAYDRTVRVWPIDEIDRQMRRGHVGYALCASFNPNGSRVVSGGSDGTVRVWEPTGAVRILTGHKGWVVAASFSPDGTRIVSSGTTVDDDDDDTVRIWDTPSGRALFGLRIKGTVSAATFSPDGTRVVTGGQDRVVRVWRADGSGAPQDLAGHTAWVRAAVWRPDGARIASGADDDTVRVWNPSTGGAPVVLRGHDGAVWSVAWSPDGQLLASGGIDQTIRLWRPARSTVAERILRGHTDRVTQVAFHPDGSRILSASLDGTVRLWRIDGAGEPVIIGVHRSGAFTAAWRMDGQRVVSAGRDGLVRLWSDFEPLTPDSPSLWRATSYCLPVALRKDILGQPEDLAHVQYARCLAQVAAASTGPAEKPR